MSTQKIEVFVRCRPLIGKENSIAVEVLSENKEIRVSDRQNYYFDHVFAPQASQQVVYKTVVGPLIEQVLLGFNCTVFAYGQTGTGKTYTMEGYRSDMNLSWDQDPHCGLIPRAVSHLFDALRDEASKFTIRASFLELYNEDAYDLLSSIDDSTKLKIYDDVHRKGSVIVGGLKEEVVNSKDDIYDILERGSAKRQTAATLLNACSSRSHTVFSITVHTRDGSMGKLNLVDLAGSENIGRSGAQDIRAREAGNINQALLTLGRVITALVEKRPHIPYRESKLTRLLQDSLGGRTKTSLIATVSPSTSDYEDTVNVLEYATRAKYITNIPEMNQKTIRNNNGINEIDRLRKELESLQERHSTEVGEIEYKVRNEVAVEFKREMERMKQSFKETYEGHMKDIIKNRDEIYTQLQDELDKKESIMKTLEDLQKESIKKESIMKTLEGLQQESNKKDLLINNLEKQILELKSQHQESTKTHQRKLQQVKEELEAKERIIANMEDQISELRESRLERRATKVPPRVPDQDEGGYADLTFDEDEIAVPSAKKPRAKANGRKKVLNHPKITLSGKKIKLERFDEILELSPLPARVTRSRATKRKLDF